MSESVTFPLKVALTGPMVSLAVARKAVSPSFTSSWHPGMQALSTSGSFSFVQTTDFAAGSCTSPVMLMAMVASFSKNRRRKRIAPHQINGNRANHIARILDQRHKGAIPDWRNAALRAGQALLGLAYDKDVKHRA